MKNRKLRSTPAKNLRRKILKSERYHLLREIVEENPDYIEALGNLGDLHTKSGDFEAGLVIDRRLAFLQPLEPVHYYNIACDYALMGKKEEALMYLNIAIALGYSDFRHLKEDPDLAGLRGDKRYEKLISRISCRRIK
ncbi:MAG: TPR end-of-group domain-containing protein [Candidatus Ratteibacteria bacterium]